MSVWKRSADAHDHFPIDQINQNQISAADTHRAELWPGSAATAPTGPGLVVRLPRLLDLRCVGIANLANFPRSLQLHALAAWLHVRRPFVAGVAQDADQLAAL